MRIIKTLLVGLTSTLLLTTSCETVDCTLYNKVSMGVGFYDSDGLPTQLSTLLTVTAIGTDSILLNKSAQQLVRLPLSYTAEVDTFVLKYINDGQVVDQDIVMVEKTNRQHFESPDCPTRVFHDIVGVKHTSNRIDSIHVLLPTVEYGEFMNLKIFVKDDEK